MDAEGDVIMKDAEVESHSDGEESDEPVLMVEGTDGTDNEDTDDEPDENEEPKEKEVFNWSIPNFSKVEGRLYSEPFKHDGFEWRILVFPRGNKTPHVSMFCEVYKNKELPAGWHRPARFTYTIVNQRDDTKSLTKSEVHVFYSREADWGWTKFIPLSEINDEEKGFKVDDTVMIRATIEYISDTTGLKFNGSWGAQNRTRTPYKPYDSKKETGFVGLRNQGATCYMNSLLQTMYHLGHFRRAVYEMPTENDWENNPEKSIPLALQRVFYHLQFSNSSVSTKKLTKSFGWDSFEAFTQHDIQELNRVLCDNLEGKMKGTRVDGTIERLFKGKVFNYIKCLNVDYQSTRTEDFYDLQLNVKGCGDLYKSFEEYVEVETLDGENKYHAEGHGLQDAKKGVMLHTLPPVLELQLKRFEYNFQTDSMCKINDKHIFYPEIDIRPYVLEDNLTDDVCTEYVLFSVLVHSGDVHGGHYYAYIRPSTGPQWFRFDDDRVSKATPDQAMNSNFGGEEKLTHTNMFGQKVTSYHKKSANAYMLVYIRKSEIASVLDPVDEEQIPDYLKAQFQKESEDEAKRKKEKQEAYLYADIHFLFDDDIKAQEVGQFDLIDWEKTELFRLKVKKDRTLVHVKERLAEEKLNGINPERIRFWKVVSRTNDTYRPERLYTPDIEARSLNQLRIVMDEWKLFVEIAPETPNADGKFFAPYQPNMCPTFFKFYEPETQAITYLGWDYVDNSKNGDVLLPYCRRLKGLPEDQELLVFEEIRPSMVDPIQMDKSLASEQIGAGDIIVFQLAVPEENDYKWPTADLYYKYIVHRIDIDFFELSNPEEKLFTLEMFKIDTFDTVCEKVGKHINWDPKKLRFTPYNTFQNAPNRQPCRKKMDATLKDMLQVYLRSPISPTLYFEKLDIDLAVLDTMKILKLKIVSLNSTIEKEVPIMTPVKSNIGNVRALLREKLELDADTPLRIFEVYSSKIHRELQDTTSILYMESWTNLLASITPEEDRELQPGERMINVAHCEVREPTIVAHGIPFSFKLIPGEEFSETKERLKKRIPDADVEEFDTFKFGIVSFGRPQYLDDTDVLAEKELHNIAYLGIFHKNKNPVKVNRYRRAEVPIKIYN